MGMMGELGLFLGLQIRQTAGGIMIHQQKYLREILKEYTLENCKAYDTYVPTFSKLDVDKECRSFVVQREVWFPLVPNSSTLDIIFSMCARFKKQSQGVSSKGCLKNTQVFGETYDLCLWYPKGTCIELVGQIDANYVDFLLNKKNTSGMAHFLGSCLIMGLKNHNSMALSTVELE